MSQVMPANAAVLHRLAGPGPKLARSVRFPRQAYPCFRGSCVTSGRLEPSFLSQENVLDFWGISAYPNEFALGWRSSGVEQLICNQPVGGSNPFASSSLTFLAVCSNELY